MEVKITNGHGWYSDEVGNIYKIGSIKTIVGIDGLCLCLSHDSDRFIRSENCILESRLFHNTPVKAGDIVYIDNCIESPEVNQHFGEVVPSTDVYGFMINIPSKAYGEQAYISELRDTWRIVQRDGILQTEDKYTVFEGKSNDNINHPNHYNNSKFETIELIEEVVKHYDNGFVSYCIGNALKYLSRAPFKHDEPLEDTKKAAKYLEFAINHLEKDSK